MTEKESGPGALAGATEAGNAHGQVQRQNSRNSSELHRSASGVDWPAILDTRKAMHAGRYRVLPCVEANKAPLFSAWPSYAYLPENPEPPTPRTFNRNGEPTRIPHLGTSALTAGIVAVDIDINDAQKADAARVAFEMAAGECAGCVRMRTNSARRMLFYRAGPDVSGISSTFGDDPVKLEIFANHSGRQVMCYGRHPSGAALEYEGDGPAEIAVADLPELDRATLNRATLAALEAVGIRTASAAGSQSKGRSIRKQTTLNGAVDEIGTALHEIARGSSVHNASKRLADLLVFQIGLDDEQTAAVLASVARMAERLTPSEGKRYREMLGKAVAVASWYAERAEHPPEAGPDGAADLVKLRYWRAARERQITRAWRLLPADLRQEFVTALLAQNARKEGAHGSL